MSPRTQTVAELHSYTRIRVPWNMSEPNRALSVSTSGGAVYGWRLFRYFDRGASGLGRTVREELALRRRKRFLRIAAAIAMAWVLAIWL